MSSVEYLREFVCERLTAAAEEIFGVFQKTIVEYEEEIDRQRKLLHVVWKPEIKLHRIAVDVPPELPQQHVCKEEEDLSEQHFCIHERNSSLDQEEPEPPQIKEEQEELRTSQEGEQLALKQETDAFMLTPTHEESDHQTLNFSTDDTLSAAEKEPVINMPVISSVVSEAHSDHQLLSHSSHEAESQDHRGGKHEASGSTRNAKPKRRTHAGEKPYFCKICEKRYSDKSLFNTHVRGHQEKPHSCNICGRRFIHKSSLNTHIKAHNGEKPYSCRTCGKGFGRNSDLIVHIRTHTGEKPFRCKTCGKCFSQRSSLNTHIRIHTGEKPFSCNTCGTDFRRNSHLLLHISRYHTGERKAHKKSHT